MSSAPIRPLSIETEPATPLALSDTGGLGGHPRGLTTLFFTELWERFSYYGMRALLVLFMVKTAAEGGLGYDTKQATAVYGTYTMSVYLLSILGGFIADNFIGARRAVFVGGIIIATGHFTMALNSTATFYAGLVFVALGTGLLKPNISTMVGSLYRPDDERRDAGFSIFYLGINLGAFAAPLVTGYLAQSDHWKSVLVSWGFNPIYSWHWGFAAAGVGMVLGLVVYSLQRERLAHVGAVPAPEADGSRPWGKLGLVALGSLALIIAMKASDTYPVIIYALFAVQIAAILFFALRPDRDSKRMAAILVFFFAAEIFWALFEQSGSTIALFSDRLTRNEIFGWSFPSSYWQSVNSIWVVLLAPIFAFLWVHLRDRQPSSPNEIRPRAVLRRALVRAHGAGRQTHRPGQHRADVARRSLFSPNRRRDAPQPRRTLDDDEARAPPPRRPRHGHLVPRRRPRQQTRGRPRRRIQKRQPCTTRRFLPPPSADRRRLHPRPARPCTMDEETHGRRAVNQPSPHPCPGSTSSPPPPSKSSGPRA
jgi:proton-dependent oligopeptide transporter, POT family